MNFTRTDDGTTTLLRIRGELDALSAPELRPVLDALIDERRAEVTVNLSELRLIDSSGVGTLVSLFKRIRAIGGAVRFVGVTGQPLVIFKLLRLDVVFGIASGDRAPVYGLERAPLDTATTGEFSIGR